MRIRCTRQDILDSLKGASSKWYQVNECDNESPHSAVWVALKGIGTLEQGSIMMSETPDGWIADIARYACSPYYRGGKIDETLLINFIGNIKSSYAPYIQMPAPRKQSFLQKIFSL